MEEHIPLFAGDPSWKCMSDEQSLYQLEKAVERLNNIKTITFSYDEYDFNQYKNMMKQWLEELKFELNKKKSNKLKLQFAIKNVL